MKKKLFDRGSGFTLIELTVVMAIIAVLALMIVAAIQAARRTSTNTQRTANVKTIETALESRFARCQGYFAAGATAPCNVAISNNNFSTAAANLQSAGFLSQALTIDSAAAYSLSSVSDTNFVITVNAVDGNVLYTATR